MAASLLTCTSEALCLTDILLDLAAANTKSQIVPWLPFVSSPPVRCPRLIKKMAKQFTLPDGRILDYSVSGAPDGFPLVWLHGTPGAYTEIPSLVAGCEKKGLKLISFSRAGYGGSSRNKDRRIVDNTADVQALLEHLGHERCVVGGWSGGGKFARRPPGKGYLNLTKQAHTPWRVLLD